MIPKKLFSHSQGHIPHRPTPQKTPILNSIIYLEENPSNPQELSLVFDLDNLPITSINIKSKNPIILNFLNQLLIKSNKNILLNGQNIFLNCPEDFNPEDSKKYTSVDEIIHQCPDCLIEEEKN